MEPFNIKILFQDIGVTLTVLPAIDDRYRIVYFGSILGGVYKVSGKWTRIDPQDVATLHLPVHGSSHQNYRVAIVLTDEISAVIGERIQQHLQNRTTKIPGHLRSIRD